MTDDVSRRELLTAGAALGATAGIVALAGCSDDTEEPPVDIDEQEALAIADIDRPEDIEVFPIDVSDEAVDERIERTESLLEPIPDDLEGEIPNEAVREHIEDGRTRALEALEDDQLSNYARLSRLRSARPSAADAEGSYAVVREDRTPSAVEDELTDLENGPEALESELSWSGEDLQATAVVYDTIEHQLERAERALNEAAEDRPEEPDFERVGYLSDRHERAMATLDDAEYLLDRQADRGDRSFEEAFEDVISNQLEDHRKQIEELPMDFDEATELLYGEPTDGSVHEGVTRQLIRAPERTYDRARKNLESDRPARAVLDVLTLESDLLAIEYVESNDELAIEHPEDADDVEAAKRTAIEAIETAASSADDPYFTGQLLEDARNDIERSDATLEESHSEFDVTWATASYLVGTIRARVAEEAAERLVASLPQ